MKEKVYQAETISEFCWKYRNGKLVRDIVIETGVPRSTIYYWLKQYGNIKTVEDVAYKKA